MTPYFAFYFIQLKKLNNNYDVDLRIWHIGHAWSDANTVHVLCETNDAIVLDSKMYVSLTKSQLHFMNRSPGQLQSAASGYWEPYAQDLFFPLQPRISAAAPSWLFIVLFVHFFSSLWTPSIKHYEIIRNNFELLLALLLSKKIFYLCISSSSLICGL